MGTWTNNDGLRIKYGADEATAIDNGAYRFDGPLQLAEVEFTATSLGSSAAVVGEGLVIPSGARIEKVEVVAETACTSAGSATLQVGLIRTDRTTELDYDGFVLNLALTSIDAVGDVVTLIQGSTGHGALVGTTLANAGVITAHYGTAAYTAGVLKVRVYFYIP